MMLGGKKSIFKKPVISRNGRQIFKVRVECEIDGPG